MKSRAHAQARNPNPIPKPESDRVPVPFPELLWLMLWSHCPNQLWETHRNNLEIVCVPVCVCGCVWVGGIAPARCLLLSIKAQRRRRWQRRQQELELELVARCPLHVAQAVAAVATHCSTLPIALWTLLPLWLCHIRRRGVFDTRRCCLFSNMSRCICICSCPRRCQHIPPSPCLCSNRQLPSASSAQWIRRGSSTGPFDRR